jgi:hypothetical protein
MIGVHIAFLFLGACFVEDKPPDPGPFFRITG